MHLAAGELQVDSASPAYAETLQPTIQISTAPADRSSQKADEHAVNHEHADDHEKQR